MIKRNLYIFILSVLFFACSNNIPDVSDIKVNPKIVRIDKILFEKDVKKINKWLPEISATHRSFMDIYTSRIVIAGGLSRKAYIRKMQYFVVYTTTFEIDKAIQKQFRDFDKIKNEIIDFLKFYKYYFPDNQIPNIYTFVSGFNQSVIVGTDFIGVGLDKYLGPKSHYYADMNIPLYQRYRANKKFIPVDLCRALAYYQFEYPDTTENLLNKMIYEGKIQYFIDKMFPYNNDTLKIAYTEQQIQWCKNNEKNVWVWFVENKKLLSDNIIDIKRYTGEAPFTADFSRESPGRLGVWIGWQIIRSYMKNNPKVSLQDLMKDDDFQKIMNLSKYNP